MSGRGRGRGGLDAMGGRVLLEMLGRLDGGWMALWNSVGQL